MQTLLFSLFTFAPFHTIQIGLKRSGKNYEKITKEVGDEKVISNSVYFYAIGSGLCHSRIWSRKSKI